MKKRCDWCHIIGRLIHIQSIPKRRPVQQFYRCTTCDATLMYDKRTKMWTVHKRGRSSIE